ncbi:DedA family protein [Arthrobacter sp. UYCu511]|uniref:DedA family protein n=1 Tax=Arthrobacter sp. UYCu511 TaxID=3156337 RepID=UPI003399BA15
MGNFKEATITGEDKSPVDFLGLIDQINVTIEHSAAQWWVIPVVALFCLIDGFFLFLPSETAIVALASIASREGYPNIWLLILGASFGAIIGDNIAYWLGRRLGVERFRWMRWPRSAKAFAWAGKELEKRGAILIFTARYIPVGRIAVNFTAGATRFRWRQFVILDSIAVLTWASYSVAVGTFAGRWVHDNPLLGVVIAVVFAIGIGFLVDHAMKLVHRILEKRGLNRDVAVSGTVSDLGAVPAVPDPGSAVPDPAAPAAPAVPDPAAPAVPAVPDLPAVPAVPAAAAAPAVPAINEPDQQELLSPVGNKIEEVGTGPNRH